MATWRNIMHRKEHKERSQPKKRKRFGLLEKHKDYVERAKNFHSKQDRLNEMRRKAAFKNPDEFYFAMKNTKTKKGVHTVQNARPDAYLSAEMQKLVSSQDLSYVLPFIRLSYALPLRSVQRSRPVYNVGLLT